jgi:hypothetical protein
MIWATARSNQIKPDQTCLLILSSASLLRRLREKACGCATFAPYLGFALGFAGIKANQTQSKQQRSRARRRSPFPKQSKLVKPSQTIFFQVSPDRRAEAAYVITAARLAGQ